MKIFKTNKNEYSAKLSIKNLIGLEDSLGQNPVNIVGTMAEGKIPKTGDMLKILFYSIKDYNHGIKLGDMYDIYEDYIAAGNSVVDLVTFVTELLQDSGVMGKPDDDEPEAPAEDNEKN